MEKLKCVYIYSLLLFVSREWWYVRAQTTARPQTENIHDILNRT